MLRTRHLNYFQGTDALVAVIIILSLNKPHPANCPSLSRSDSTYWMRTDVDASLSQFVSLGRSRAEGTGAARKPQSSELSR